VKVSADGDGVVSHAGVALLREAAQRTGLVAGVTAALADTYRGPWVHAPGQVFADLAVSVADGADAVSGIEVPGDRERRCCGCGSPEVILPVWSTVQEQPA